MRLHRPLLLFTTAVLTVAELTLAAEVQSIAWKECGDHVFCGNFNVPLDWDCPGGPKVSLYVNKILAKTKDRKQVLGSLFYSPGGPGLSGTDDAGQFVKTFGKALNERYDIVGIDPRGNGHSSPLNCDDSIAGDELTSDWPTAQSELDKLRRKNRDFAQSCLARSGKLAEHVDTLSVAKDLEVLRRALHAPKLHFLAISYATQIATDYLSLYPQNAGRIVMDVITDETTKITTNFISSATAVERSFNRWADWCENNKTCVFRPNTRQRWTTILQDLDTNKLTLEHTRPNGQIVHLTSKNLIRLARAFFYTPTTGWPKLAQALHDLPNTTLLFSNFDPEDENIKSLNAKNISYYGGTAVTCLDNPHIANLSLSQFQNLSDLGREVAPYTRGLSTPFSSEVLGCIGWPFKGLEKVVADPQPAGGKVLLIQSKFDPSTLFKNALDLRKRLGKTNSRLVVREGDGSLNYFQSEEVRKIVDKFLLEGEMPLDGTVVESDSMGKGYGT